MASARLRVIGHLRSCLREKFAAPRQPLLAPGATASLTLKREFLPEHSLVGLDGFSHVWLFSYFHLNTNKKFLPKVRPPRLKGAAIGLFASRSPHRPSALGLSLARLVRVEGATLHLAGVDLVDGTPILDVKPYIPEWDSVPHADAGWVKDAPFPTLKVAFSPRARRDAAAAEKRLKVAGLVRLITDLLTQDPRNPRDKSQNEEGLELGFFLHDFEARFFVRKGVATVVKLLTGTTMHKKTPVAPPRAVGLDA
ncbi:MAG: tRNA (N6-threonylcarbamoyladenosine(37)-N6)-methyltransferase TrmO [Elusimicrobiota bacterium]|nr:tRNA (N6-threonylcarbamoyladenosine(37)-N6)-methyltransferase TrmO [Elusimicrobiota bacterium]